MTDPARLEVRTSSATYPVCIGTGLLERAHELIPPSERAREIIAIVTDANVRGLHGARLRTGLDPLGARIEEFTIEPGERSKDAATLESVWRWLAGIGAHRGDLVVALGGGVVGDLAGFAAATFHRGIDFVQVPTTLLGQVDAAIGGKTAIDLPEGKNLVGAFHQPRAVLCDVDTLRTLPDDDFATGMAEIVKHSLIEPGHLGATLAGERDAIIAREPDVLARVVHDAAAVKVRIVGEDETERGVRAFLNYGHTLGHALETAAGYDGITHGEAVAIGMMFAAHLGARTGRPDLVDVHRVALDAFGLPTGGAGFDFEVVAKAWARDKKYDAGMRFVLLDAPGMPALVSGIDEADLRAAYEEVR